jgi:hypothetical protein
LHSIQSLSPVRRFVELLGVSLRTSSESAVKFLTKTLSLIALSASIHSPACALDAQQVFERVSPSVVVVKTGSSQGSGVVYAVDNTKLTPSTFILTNCHVVKGHSQVTVERLGKKAGATVLVCDAKRDMAVLTLGGALPTVPIRTTALKVGEPTFAVGAPQGLELSISQGIVSQLRITPLGKDPMIQTTAAISQGSSGGGLFDSDGRLIGLTTLYFKDGQSLNFAVPVSFVSLLKNTNSSSANVAPEVVRPNSAHGQSTYCGWTSIGDFGHNETFIDYCKVERAGRFGFAWILYNYPRPRFESKVGEYYQSHIFKLIYDCQQMKVAPSSVFQFQLKNGGGKLIWSNTLPVDLYEWNDPPPNSPAYVQINIVCR